jgi:N-acetyl-anhydromuramyl-L-alanine amidase AmpD
VAWLRNPAAKASAHLVIGRDGRIVQPGPAFPIASFITKVMGRG